MSEVYEFKAMSQVETLEGPTETTTVLAVEDGAVRQIPASAVGGGSGFMVRGSIDTDTGGMTADKPYAEIVAAVEAGAVPTLCMKYGANFFLLPLVSHNDGMLAFAAVLPDTFMMITCTADNEWALQPME